MCTDCDPRVPGDGLLPRRGAVLPLGAAAAEEIFRRSRQVKHLAFAPWKLCRFKRQPSLLESFVLSKGRERAVSVEADRRLIGHASARHHNHPMNIAARWSRTISAPTLRIQLCVHRFSLKIGVFCKAFTANPCAC